MGNFDHVFEQHARDVYRPLLERIREREFFPIVLHISGPLLEWLEAHDAAYLDLIGRLASDGKVELLSSGFYEPVLAALPRQDRLEQLTWMRDAIRRRFGVEPAGLWLQLGAFSSAEGAESFREHATRQMPWMFEPISVMQRDGLHRVRLGPYRTREEADAIADKVRQSLGYAPTVTNR